MKYVVVRSSVSGVWFGQLVDQSDAHRKVRLANARRAWKWTGATECAGLAVRGPKGGNITEEVSSVDVFDIAEVLAATDEAVKAWKAVAAWKI